MRRFTALLVTLPLATALAAGAGDNIKWSKSKKLTYYSPASDYSEFEDNPSSIKDGYVLKWSPYFNNDIDNIIVQWCGWEWVVTNLNRAIKNGEITRSAYDKRIKEERAKTNQYVIFEIWIGAKNEQFYEKATDGYWEFVLITDERELEPTSIKHEGSLEAKSVSVNIGGTQRDIYDTAGLLMHKFDVLFDNPYSNETPRKLKLIIRSEQYSRGFEWRFKEE